MLKILITGPESSGKSRLSQYLARQFHAPYVPEFARMYLTALDRPYQKQDLLHILNGQLRKQGQYDQVPLLFCDTGPEVIHIWSWYKYGHVDAYITQQVQQQYYDLRLLCYPDLPWQPDPLREAPDDTVRETLFNAYTALMNHFKYPYIMVYGQGQARENIAFQAVQKLIQDS